MGQSPRESHPKSMEAKIVFPLVSLGVAQAVVNVDWKFGLYANGRGEYCVTPGEEVVFKWRTPPRSSSRLATCPLSARRWRSPGRSGAARSWAPITLSAHSQDTAVMDRRPLWRSRRIVTDLFFFNSNNYIKESYYI